MMQIFGPLDFLRVIRDMGRRGAFSLHRPRVGDWVADWQFATEEGVEPIDLTASDADPVVAVRRLYEQAIKVVNGGGVL